MRVGLFLFCNNLSFTKRNLERSCTLTAYGYCLVAQVTLSEYFSRLTAGVTGKCGIYQTKPPDAESAPWGLFPKSVGSRPHLSGARGVGRSAASTHARYQITSKPRQTPVLLSYPKFCLNILCASSLVIVEYSGCPLGR